MTRSRWKNPFISESLWRWFILHAKELQLNRKTRALTYKNVAKKRKLLKKYHKTAISTYKELPSIRSTTIVPIMEGYTFWVHDGRAYRPVSVKKSMIGTTFGDYVHTKLICVYRRSKDKKKKNSNKKKKQVKKKK